jgi:hypothetical protein
MRVVLIIGILLLIVVSGLALVPAAEPFRAYLIEATPVLAFVLLIVALSLRTGRSAQSPATAPVRPPPEQTQADGAGTAAAHFLAILQDKGRLVDFLMDDINGYSDAQVGAAARVVHTGCKAVLQEHFKISPLRTEPEGSTVQVPAGYSADEYRLVGRIAGSAPFSGVLVHHGWKTDMVQLPQLLRGSADQLPAIAPAEVEVK